MKYVLEENTCYLIWCLDKFLQINQMYLGGISMKRQLQGIAVILVSLLLTIGFGYVGWFYVFDLDFQWQHIFMLTGLVGAVMVFWQDKKGK